MNAFPKKVKLIFVPFVFITICLVVGYTFLNWLIFVKLRLFSVNEEMLNLWIPMALPWIFVLFLLRPRIKLLNLKRKKGDLPGLYFFIAGLAMVAPMIIAQSYLETATGKLTRLDNIGQIEKQEASKYYALEHYYLDKSHIGVKSAFDVSGKTDQYFNMNLYIVVPVFATADDTAGTSCLAWYGIKYSKQINNRLDQGEKEAKFREFTQTTQEDFEEKDLRQFVYFDRIGNTNDHKGYISAIKRNKFFSRDSKIVLIPVNEPFEDRNGHKLAWIFGSFAIGVAIWLMMTAFPKFDEDALRKFESGTVEKSGSEKEFLQFFIPREGFFVTAILIDLNVLIFLVMVFAGLGFLSFKASDLLDWGGNFRPVTLDGQWWRLLTNIFLHGGAMHLFANMVGLLFIGIILEPRLGRTKYTIAYLVTGILASVASLVWHKAVVSVGASGAIFGLYGVFLALIATKAFPKEVGKVFLTSTLVFVGYNLLMGFLGGGIDNAAHIGGLVSGFILGFVFPPEFKSEADYESLAVEPADGITEKVRDAKGTDGHPSD